MKCKMAFLALTVLFVFLLSGVVSAADSDNNTAPQVQQVVQNQSQTNASALPDPVNTRTHYNSTDIQPVIDDAKTLNGDIISIKGGFTYGPVILNKTLTLVWDGTGTKPIIPYLYINRSGSGSTINGLDIEYNSSLNPVAGITLDGANNVVIKNCLINGFAKGLYQLNSTNSTIHGNYITNNVFYGIELINSTATINCSNNITGNDGFGIYSRDSSVHIESNTIGGNTANNVNGLSGIIISYTSPSNTVNIIKNNVIGYNGFKGYSSLTSNGIILSNARGNNIIQNNTNIGDGILLYNSVAAITNNLIYNNTVDGDGVGLYDSSTAAVTGNQIYDNWIGIHCKNSAADIKINTIGNNREYQISFENSTSTGVISNNIYGDYGLFFNANYHNVQFNRIVTKYCSIDCFGATVDATLNWFGNNTILSTKMHGTNINYDSWLVLTIIAQPNTIWTNGTSKVIADFKHDNKGNIHNEGYVPDGIPLNFSNITLGALNSLFGSTVNGLVTATFTAGAITGLSNVNATVDSQNVSTNISIGVPPVVNATPDQGNFYAPVNVNLNARGEYSPYKIFFTADGSTPTTSSAQYSEPIIFNTTHTLKYFVQDKFDNISPIYTKQYNIYKLITYKYSVKMPVKKWYKSKGKWKYRYATVKVKKWYKKLYKYKGKWKSKWKWKWVTVIKYATVYKTGQRWLLT